MDILEILPAEMWECVISKLDTYEGKVTAYNTSPLWRSFLIKDRTEWMFEGIFPSLAKYLPTSDILNCRQVCKSWNKGVDSYLQTDQPIFDTTPQYHYQLSNNWYGASRPWGVNFNKMGDATLDEALTRFQTDFSPSGVPTAKNPFISRSLVMTIKEINSTVEEFFEKFGTHLECLVLNFHCVIREGITCKLQLVKFLWKLLRYIPNVQQLALQTNLFNKDIHTNSLRLTSAAPPRKVEAFFKQNSAPPLPHLRSIVLSGTCLWMYEILETAYGCPQPTRNYVTCSHLDSLPRDLYSLNQLGWNITGPNCMEDMRRLANLECPSLRQLYIYVNPTNPAMYAEKKHRNIFAHQLFEAIERFQSSLTHLEIVWKHLVPFFPAQFNMPHLQELSMRIPACEGPENLSISFLQSLPSLRKIKCVFYESSYTHFVKKSATS